MVEGETGGQSIEICPLYRLQELVAVSAITDLFFQGGLLRLLLLLLESSESSSRIEDFYTGLGIVPCCF